MYNVIVCCVAEIVLLTLFPLLIVRLPYHWQPILHTVLQPRLRSIRRLLCMDLMQDMESVSTK